VTMLERENGSDSRAFGWRGFLLHTVPLLGYVAAIFVLGAARLDGAPMAGVAGVDKLGHGLAFAILTWLAASSLRVHAPRLGLFSRAVAASVGATAVGGLLEFMQAGLPHRSADGWDLVADALGALGAGILLVWAGWSSRPLPATSRKCA